MKNKRPLRTGLDRISTEEQEEAAMTELLTARMTEQGLPGAMSTGKVIEATSQSPGQFAMRFTDGTALVFSGEFVVSYVEQSPEFPGATRTDIVGEE